MQVFKANSLFKANLSCIYMSRLLTAMFADKHRDQRTESKTHQRTTLRQHWAQIADTVFSGDARHNQETHYRPDSPSQLLKEKFIKLYSECSLPTHSLDFSNPYHRGGWPSAGSTLAESDNCKVTARDRRSVCHMHWSQGGTVAVYWLHQLRMLSARQVPCRQACRTRLQACGDWL